MKMRVSLGVKPSLTRTLEYVVYFVFHGFSLRISHYSGGKFYPQKKRGLNTLPTPSALGRPRANSKTKAHAVWREHFAH